jgi:farnesol dehydrogenase
VKVLITGGTGFLGKRVAHALAGRGHELRLLTRPGSRLTGLPEGIETVRGDVTDGDSLKRAAEGCQALLHMAALVKMWVPDRAVFDAVNVGGLENALAAAEAVGARLVYTSSFIAVGPTGSEPVAEDHLHAGDRYRNDYERTKALADGVARRAMADGRELVCLYPGVVYGPGEMTDGNLVAKMIADHVKGKLPGIVGPGDRLWSYAFVGDVAEGHAAALEKGRAGERYFLGGPNHSHRELFALLTELAGSPPPRHIPYPAATAVGFAMWLWAELTGHPPELTHREVGVFREHWAYSSEKARAELGYEPTPLREGLRQTLDWLREEGLA